ncbi:hypothetical protein ACF0H5_008884 [Mactra antiquata]
MDTNHNGEKHGVKHRVSIATDTAITDDEHQRNEFRNNAKKRHSIAVGDIKCVRNKLRRYSLASMQMWAPPMLVNDIQEEDEDFDDENATVDVITDPTDNVPILYKINDSPPIYLTIFFAIQQSLLSIAGSLILPLLVAKAACATDDDEFIIKLVSSALFLSGITTFFQVLFGIRLPVYQGPTAAYVVPIIALNEIDPTRCDVNTYIQSLNMTTNDTSILADMKDELIDIRIREMMGPLILVGFIHFLVGASGIVGYLLRFIGPVTIVPTILLIGIYIVKPALDYTQVHWGIAMLTWGVSVVLSMYLGHKPMPIPVWTRKKGCHIIRYPLHQVFGIMISILVGWGVCGILTISGALTGDKTNIQYNTRTDAKIDVIINSDWFYLPHPGQFGAPLFSVNAVIGFLIATITSILDSIGDYYATAAICRVPTPPNHAVNRGIAVEGLFSMISGTFGVAHATTTYGGNIGAIGMTRVARRHVFIALALIYVILGVLAKVSAVFVSIPYPVLGGSLITIIVVFVGVNLSNLKVLDLGSTRNLSIIGTAIFVGLLVPTWIEKSAGAIDTGNSALDQVLLMFLGNPNFLGGFLACFMDNTIRGTDKERGITAWTKTPTDDDDNDYLEGDEIYEPPIPQCLKRQKWLRFIPLFPKYNFKNTNIQGVANDVTINIEDEDKRL